MLYSFDLRMRTGDWHWDDEEVGMTLQAGREWERNWDKRWALSARCMTNTYPFPFYRFKIVMWLVGGSGADA